MAGKMLLAYNVFLILLGVILIISAIVHVQQMKISFNKYANSPASAIEVLMMMLITLLNIFLTPIVILIMLLTQNFKRAGWSFCAGILSFLMMFASWLIDISIMSV